MEAIDHSKWFEKNLPRLLGWFDAEGHFELIKVPEEKLQIFKEPIYDRPGDLLRAVRKLKISLLRCAILGAEATFAHPDCEDGLYCFPGFLEQVGRLPKDNEYCVFDAKSWFQYCEIERPQMIFSSSQIGNFQPVSIPAIGCVCRVRPFCLDQK